MDPAEQKFVEAMRRSSIAHASRAYVVAVEMIVAYGTPAIKDVYRSGVEFEQAWFAPHYHKSTIPDYLAIDDAVAKLLEANFRAPPE